MKYVNGMPEGRKPIVLYKGKTGRKARASEKRLMNQLAMDPSLKAESQRDREHRNWEKEMRNPGEIEHKRELVNSLRGGKALPKKPEEKKKIVVREPLEPVAKVILTNKDTGTQATLWFTENIIYQDIANGTYWVYNELAQKSITAIITETRIVEHRGKAYWCKLLKKATDRDLQSYLVDLKKAERTNKK